jgi:hypothetical protein
MTCASGVKSCARPPTSTHCSLPGLRFLAAGQVKPTRVLRFVAARSVEERVICYQRTGPTNVATGYACLGLGDYTAIEQTRRLLLSIFGDTE